MRRKIHRLLRNLPSVHRRVFRPVLCSLEARTLLSTITWASDVSGDWDDPTMWTGGAVPGPSDNALISFSDITVTHSIATADSVNSINSQAALDLTNGSVAIANSSSISGSLMLQGGTLTTAGPLTVDGSMTWTGGTISGGGSLNIAQGATLSIGGYQNADTLDGVLLDNAGTATMAATVVVPTLTLTLANGAGIDNQATGTFSFPTNFSGTSNAAIATDGSATFFNNEGTLIQPADNNGETIIDAVFTQAAGATTVLQAGEIYFNGGGTISGSITGVADTEVAFAGTVSLAADSSLTAGYAVFSGTVTDAGSYDVSARTQNYYGTLTFTAPITDLGTDLNNFGTINLPGQSFTCATVENIGTLNGGGGASLTVTSSMNWEGGTITGFGSLNIAQGATLSIGGYQNADTLDGVLLDNAGTATMAATVVVPTLTLTLANGGGIDNQATGTFSFPTNFSGTSNAAIATDGSATFFNNEGTLIQPADNNGETIIDAVFTQAAGATTVLQAGEIYFNGGGTISGSITGVADTEVAFAGTVSLAADSSLTAGYAVFSGTVTDAGSYDVSARTQNYYGTLTFTAPITDLGTDLNNFGTINLPGQSFTCATVENIGTLNGGGGASLTVTSSMNWEGGTITGFGSLNIAQGATLSIGGYQNADTLDGVFLDNAGTATMAATVVVPTLTLTLANGGGIDNQATGTFSFPTNFSGTSNAAIATDGSATFFNNEGTLIQPADNNGETNIDPAFTQAAGGTTSIQAGQITFQSTATNAGTVSIASGASLGVGTYTQTGGSTVLDDSTINGGSLNIDGGALTGTGSIDATVANGGLVIPGGTGAAGILTINGSYTQSATGALDIDIGGTTAGSQYDQLAVSGAAALGGTADVSIINGFQPALADTFQPLTFASSTGQFGFYNGIVLGNRLLLDPSLNPTNLTLAVQPAVTTTTLAASPSPSVSGQNVTVTATVTVALPPTTIDPVPTGTVTFYNNGTSIGTGMLNVVSGQDQASLTVATLSTDSHTITAAYTSGDTNFIPSPTSTALTQVVNKANPSASVASSGTPSVHGQSVIFTATVSVVSPGSTAVAYPTGTVTFYDNGSSIGAGTLSVVSGHDQATFTATTLGTATHSITAAYTGGDGNFNASAVSFAISQVVNKDSTTTTAGASPSSANLGQIVTFTATLSANSPGSGTPTGTVDFYDTTTSTDLTPGGVALSSGTAAFATTSLTAGAHTIKATYSGDGNFLTSNGTAGTVTVGQSIIVLDPSAGGALSLSGNASINLPGGVFVNSSSSTALSASGNAQIKATVIDVHGGVQKSGNASFTPAPTTGVAIAADPYTSLAEPSTSGLTNYGAESLSGNSSATIKPGVYSGISVSGNGTLTMSSGLYIIEGGGFSISGNASVSGTGVTIFNAGSKYPTTGGTYGSISLSGNGSYNLTPPTTGTYAGIVIFQSRDNTKALTVSGNASGMTGTIYAPAAQLGESGNAELNASIDVDTLAISGNGVSNAVALSSPAGTVAYAPAQIRAAYGINSVAYDGTGQTIAIVDAYDDPSIDQALDAFDSQFGLTSSGPTLYAQYSQASSFLTVLNQNGQATSLPSTDPNGPDTNNWEVEEALDVEWTHAVAPGAQIILVEATSQSLSDLMASVATAAHQPGVSVVSMSWGFPEGQAVFASDEATYDSTFNVAGVTFVASTGDYGAADPEYPAFSSKVVAVGGTTLTLNADNSYNSETGWGYYSSTAGTFVGSGGGLSLYEPEPAYQQGVQSTGMRTTPDVSLVADPATGAWIADPYNLDPSDPFEVVGGTSLSAPAWAGLLALANQGRAAVGESTLNSSSPSDTQQALYMLPQSDYNAIASGSNGYSAGAGYNLVTGLGTPVANLLVPDLVAYQGTGTTYAGPTVGPLQVANLVNTGARDAGPMDVFSVFDALTVTSDGHDKGLYSPVAKRQAAGGARTRTIPQDIGQASAPAALRGGGMMPLDTTAAVDAILIGWTYPSASAARRLAVQGGDTLRPGTSGRIALTSVPSRTKALDSGSIDALLGGPRMLHSLLDGDGTLLGLLG